MYRFGYEYEKKARLGFKGCGGHSFRNLYPCFQYLPAELIAVCSRTKSKAETFARMFGAERAYTNYRDLLEREKLDALFIVLNSAEDTGKPRYLQFVLDAFRAAAT